MEISQAPSVHIQYFSEIYLIYFEIMNTENRIFIARRIRGSQMFCEPSIWQNQKTKNQRTLLYGKKQQQ